MRDRPGLLRAADEGVLFLDEIGELGADEQGVLLRALEEKRFLPLGADREVKSDFQLIAGTNADLAAAVNEFEQTLEATRAGQREHVGASADLQAVATEISQQVRLLDGLVRYRFGDNRELMGAWASARNVLGSFRSQGESEVGGGETPDAAKPAA